VKYEALKAFIGQGRHYAVGDEIAEGALPPRRVEQMVKCRMIRAVGDKEVYVCAVPGCGKECYTKQALGAHSRKHLPASVRNRAPKTAKSAPGVTAKKGPGRPRKTVAA